MNVAAILNALVVLAVVAWVLYRQTIARPVVARRLWVLPGILIVIGIAAISHVGNGNLTGTAILFLAVDLVSSVVLGVIRGCFVRVYAHDGVMWRRGGVVVVSLWMVSIGIRVIVAVLAGRSGSGDVLNAALELTLGITLLAQNGVIALRGTRLGIPFAPDYASRRARRVGSSG